LLKSIADTLCSKVPQCILNFMELLGVPFRGGKGADGKVYGDIVAT